MKDKSKAAIAELRASHAAALEAARAAPAAAPAADPAAAAERDALRAKVEALEAAAAAAPPPKEDGWGDDGWGEGAGAGGDEGDDDKAAVLARKDAELANVNRKLEAVVDRYKQHKQQGKLAIE